jgi:sulfate-transporting ATPase
MITGKETPDAGTLKVGETVQMAYVDQGRDDLDADKTVWENISEGAEELDLGRREGQQPRLLLGFQLQGPRAAKKVGTCRAASAIACTWPGCSRAAPT